ncbi:MAG: methyltransferase domain-containing protein [Hyphomicrobiales bacterium]|nr:methyltransferase domain-containing protein [Hyphomicrobiales bacterium]
MSSWRDFFDGEHSIYVSERHKLLHARIIARGIIAAIPRSDAVVLDHGCGEALHGEAVAAACGRLYLCESAPVLRAQLTARFINSGHVSIIAPETIEIGIPDDSLDLVTFISVAQYLKREELDAALHLWLQKLKPGGKLVVGDVIPPDVGMVTDTRALLSFAFSGGFLIAALAGLVKTAFSDYRKLRDNLGLSMYSTAQMETVLDKAGFVGIRQIENIGHNAARMTFEAARPA